MVSSMVSRLARWHTRKKKTTTSVTSFLESEGYKEFYGLILFIVDIEHDLKKHSIHSM